MARIFPENEPTRLPRSVVRVWQQLKRIQSDDLICRMSYPLDGVPRPEFLVIYREQYVFLLAVCNAATEQIEEQLQGDLFDSGSVARQLDLRERHTMEHFVEAVAGSLGVAEPGKLGVQKWILFPRASSHAVQRLLEAIDWPDYFLLGREGCSAESLAAHFERSCQSPLAEILLQSLRGRFSPEVVIPPQWIGKEPPPARCLEPQQTDFFLDYDQESALKRDLELSPEAKRVADAGSLRLITGVAGCGKTLVLLLRARMAAKLNVDSRILVLMHNRALKADLAARAHELDPDIQIEWSTFLSWVRRFMSYSVLEKWESASLIRSLLDELSAPGELAVDFLQDEFDWISENAVASPTRDWYLEVDRTGRHKALQRPQREAVFSLYYSYRSRLKELRKNDWAGIPQTFLRKLEAGHIRLPRYDAIFIDEAQFFAPVWFACVRAALHPDHGNLFMVADPTQGFLRNGQSWNQILGREVRGRAQRLERPYRNTRPLMDLAKHFYLSRIQEEEDEVNLPDEHALKAMPDGELARFRFAPTPQDERTIIANEVSAALAGGLSPGRILIIHADYRQTQDLLRLLDERHPGLAVEAGEAVDREHLRVCTINACTGLEAPLVIFAGVDRLFEAENDLSLSPAERTEHIRNNTKRIFVALTRATNRLLVCYRHEKHRRTLCPDDDPRIAAAAR